MTQSQAGPVLSTGALASLQSAHPLATKNALQYGMKLPSCKGEKWVPATFFCRQNRSDTIFPRPGLGHTESSRSPSDDYPCLDSQPKFGLCLHTCAVSSWTWRGHNYRISESTWFASSLTPCKQRQQECQQPPALWPPGLHAGKKGS